MNLRQFTPGARVALRRQVDVYPVDIFPAGLTGTVSGIDRKASPTQPVAWVRLDQHFESLVEWDNELQVFRHADQSSDVTEDAFALITQQPVDSLPLFSKVS